MSDKCTWTGACGVVWQFTTDGPKENGVKFCLECGKPVVVYSRMGTFAKVGFPKDFTRGRSRGGRYKEAKGVICVIGCRCKQVGLKRRIFLLHISRDDVNQSGVSSDSVCLGASFRYLDLLRKSSED
jgi:hypothetical protein